MRQISFRAFIFSLSVCVLTVSCGGQRAMETPQKNLSEESQTNDSILKPGNRILCMYHDSKGNYWFADNGLLHYDGTRFKRYTKADGLTSHDIRSIQEDRDGNIFLGHETGVDKFDGKSFEALEVFRDTSNRWELTDGDLWFTSNWNENGIYRYDGKVVHLLLLPKHPLEVDFKRNYPNVSYSPYGVYTIFNDSKGAFWFGTSTFGALRFDGTSFLWFSEREMTEIDPGPAPGVRSILEDRNGHFWFNANVNHKYALTDNISFQQLPGIPTAQEQNLENFFMSIAEDANGAIWMAQYEGGIWRFDGKKMRHFPIKEGNAEVQIFRIYSDIEGTIWCCTHNAGVLKFNGTAFERWEGQIEN